MDVLPQLGLSKKNLYNNTLPIKLDLRDKKILFMLSQDARMPLSKIAKVANLSRDSVNYRIKNYEANGLLKKAVTLVNVAKLGYDAYHIFLRLNNPSKEAEKKIIQEINQMPFVRAVIKFFGTYDFEIAVIAKNLPDFDRNLTEIVGAAKDFIQDYEILIITDNYRSGAFTKSFLKELQSETFHFRPQRSQQGEYIPDKKDFEIIKAIRNDAQLSSVEIGEKVNLSPDAVSYRLKKLMKNIIIAFVPVINFKAIGYNVHALLININSLDKGKEKSLSDFLKANDHVLWAVKTIGRYNVLAYICTTNESELQTTINELRNKFPEQINRYDSLLAFEEYKYTYAPDCLFED